MKVSVWMYWVLVAPCQGCGAIPEKMIEKSFKNLKLRIGEVYHYTVSYWYSVERLGWTRLVTGVTVTARNRLVNRCWLKPPPVSLVDNGNGIIWRELYNTMGEVAPLHVRNFPQLVDLERGLYDRRLLMIECQWICRHRVNEDGGVTYLTFYCTEPMRLSLIAHPTPWSLNAGCRVGTDSVRGRMVAFCFFEFLFFVHCAF